MLTMWLTMWTREMKSTISIVFQNGIGIMLKFFMIGIWRTPRAVPEIGATLMRCGLKLWIFSKLWNGGVLKIPLSQYMNWVFISGWEWNLLLLRWSKGSAVASSMWSIGSDISCVSPRNRRFSFFPILPLFWPDNVVGPVYSSLTEQLEGLGHGCHMRPLWFSHVLPIACRSVAVPLMRGTGRMLIYHRFFLQITRLEEARAIPATWQKKRGMCSFFRRFLGKSK